MLLISKTTPITSRRFLRAAFQLKHLLLPLLFWLIPGSLFYWLTAFPHLQPVLRQALIFARFGIVPIAFPALLLFIAFRWKSMWGNCFALTVILAVMGAALAGLWASGFSDSMVAGGILQWSDSQGYYTDARRLLSGMQFSSFASRRPLFAAYLASVLWLTEMNLQVTVMWLTFTSGVALYFAANEIKKTHGAAAATLFTIICFFYFRRFTGTTMSENLGFPLGLIGFAFIWRGSHLSISKQYLLGLFFLTLALIARAGPFFVLPALIGFGAWIFQRYDVPNWKWAVIAVSIVGFCFGINQILFQLLGTTEGAPFSNFSYSLYGTVSGGNNWTQIFTDHPEVQLLPEAEKSQRIYRLSWELFINKPILLFQGILKHWGVFFGHFTYYGMYSYTSGDNEIRAYLTTIALYILGATVFFRLFVRSASRSDILSLTAFLGIFASVPFVPPMDTFYLRAYGAAIAWIALPPALGLGNLITRLQFLNGPTHNNDSTAIRFKSIVLTVYVVLMIIIIPIGLKSTITTSSLVSPECPADSLPMIVKVIPGNNLRILENTNKHYSWVPYIHHYVFILRARDMPRGNVTEPLQEIPQTAVISNGYDELTGNGFWLVLPPSVSISEKHMLGVCAIHDPRVSEFGIELYYTDTIKFY